MTDKEKQMWACSVLQLWASGDCDILYESLEEAPEAFSFTMEDLNVFLDAHERELQHLDLVQWIAQRL